jgi:hypothetical protein
MALTADAIRVLCKWEKRMATPGRLVATMAEVLGVSLATVVQYDRVLAENGLRSKGGRGLSAARVTAADAANLLIAIMSSPISGAAIKDAASTCKLYAALLNLHADGQRATFRSLGFNRLASLPAEHSLHKALVALIEGAVDEELSATDPLDQRNKDQLLRVQLISPLHWAQIVVDKGLRSTKRARLIYARHLRDRRVTDLRQSRQVTYGTIRRLAATLKQPE